MDKLQQKIESKDEAFSFQSSEWILFAKDENGMYILGETDMNGEDYSMHYFKDFNRLKKYINQYFDYDYIVLEYEEQTK